MPGSRRTARIKLGGARSRALVPGERLTLGENQDLELSGLDPSSPVAVRLEGDSEYQTLTNADAAGRLSGSKRTLITQQLGIFMRAGESFEIRCQVHDEPLEFLLDMEHKTFSAEEINLMLQDLGAMELQWDADSPIPTRIGDLEDQVERFVEGLPGLIAVAESIFARPDSSLSHTASLVPVQDVRRLSPAHLRANIVQGRLDGHGRPLKKQLVDSVGVVVNDTPANAYVLAAARRLEAHRARLLGQIELERQRLDREARRERSYMVRPSSTKTPEAGPAEMAANELKKRLAILRRKLMEAGTVEVPLAWREFRSKPDRTHNVVRFDARYARFASLMSQLVDSRSEAIRNDRLKRIAEFGRRPHSEVYEVWTVCKTFEALHYLGFRTARGAGTHREAFLELEKPAGLLYGLRKNKAVTLVHKDAPHLAVRIGYEPKIPRGPNRKPLTPDIMLVIRDSNSETAQRARFRGRQYGGSPLYLDAKYQFKDLASDARDLKERLRKYADLTSENRKPHSFILQAAAGDFAWSQRKSAEDADQASRLDLGEADSDLFPYRVGVASLVPVPHGSPKELLARLPIVRIIYAWLVTQGVIFVCPRCGGGLQNPEANDGNESRTNLLRAHAFEPFLPSESESLPSQPNRRLECRHCDLVIFASYCGNCRSKKNFVPIIKLYPRNDGDEERSKSWIQDYEIAEPSEASWARHCPKCGDAPPARGR